MAKLQASCEAELDQLTQKHTMALKQASIQGEELMRNHAIERDATRDDHLALLQQYTSELEKANEVLRDTRAEHNSIVNQLKSEHSSRLDQIQQNHSENLRQLDQKHCADIAMINQIQVSEFSKLKQEHTAELNRIKKQLSDSKAIHNSLVDDLTAELSTVKTQHERITDDLTSHKGLLTTAEQTIKELNVKVQDLELELNSLAAAKGNEITKLKKLLDERQERLEIQTQYTIFHEKNAEQREKELIIKTNENVALRNKLNVCILSVSTYYSALNSSKKSNFRRIELN